MAVGRYLRIGGQNEQRGCLMIGRDQLRGGGPGAVGEPEATAPANTTPSDGAALSSRMDPPAPELHSAWLKQVTRDTVLTAVAHVIAVVLVRFADQGTNIARVSAASLAKPTGLASPQVQEALTLLCDRGHLRSLSRRGSASAYQFVQRVRPIVRRPRVAPPLQVFPFPPSRRGKLVREIVAEMFVRPQQAAEAWLQSELQRQDRALARKGFAAPVIVREIAALDAAVRRALWRAVLAPDEPA
jgi:Family of unknown function (DUF6074)